MQRCDIDHHPPLPSLPPASLPGSQNAPGNALEMPQKCINFTPSPSLPPSLTLPTPSATPPLNTPRRGAYATNSQVRNAACVCKDSLSDTRCFVRTVYAVFPPDTHGEVRVQYTLKSYTPTGSPVFNSKFHSDICIPSVAQTARRVACGLPERKRRDLWGVRAARSSRLSPLRALAPLVRGGVGGA